MFYNADCLKPTIHDWCYKWSSVPHKTVHEIVMGPLIHPMVALPLPCVFEDENNNCNIEKELKKIYFRGGIPDPWNEYLLVKEGTKNGAIFPNDFPKKDLKITKYLGEKYRLDFGQGIPDPWKKWVTLKPTKKNVLENLKNDIGIYKADGILCTNCNKQFLVFDMNKIKNRRKRGGEEEDKTEEKIENSSEEMTVINKIEGSGPSEGLPLKDASIETDKIKKDIKEIEMCNCKVWKSSSFQSSKCTCNLVKKESKPKICKCKDDNFSDNGCIYGQHRCSYRRQNDLYSAKCSHKFSSYLPHVTANDQILCGVFPISGNSGFPNGTSSPRKDKQILLSPDLPHASTFVPLIQLPTQPEHIWFSPGFFCRNKRNYHFFELKWVCRQCENKKKKKRKGKNKSEQKVDRIPREYKFCQYSESKHTNENCLCSENSNDNPNSVRKYKIPSLRHIRHQKRHPTESSRCHCHEEASNSRNILTNGKSQASDFMQLLQILGCTELFKNKRNTDYKVPSRNLN